MQIVLQLPSVPYITPEKFAEATGQKLQTVRDKCREGVYPILPRKSNQEAVMINLTLMHKRALEQEY